MSMEDAASVMDQHGWLSRCPVAFREALLSRCKVRNYAAKEAVYRDGDPPNGMMGLVAGRWIVRVPPSDVTVTIGQPGFWIGEGGIFRRMERSVSVISATASVGLYLPVAAFNELAANAEYCRHFAANTAEMLAQATAIIASLSQPRADIIVAQRLVTLAVFTNGKGMDVIPLSQAGLAELCNLSRSTVLRILHNLSEQKMISIQYRSITITDLTALTDFAWDSDRIFR
jgi:CRP-like cAMP-binding protein